MLVSSCAENSAKNLIADSINIMVKFNELNKIFLLNALRQPFWLDRKAHLHIHPQYIWPLLWKIQLLPNFVRV